MIKSHDFASTYVGTPFYMSPEICAAEKYTLKSDIWSLGCIIYELCSREPPFNAKTHFQLVQKIKEGKVAPLPDMYSPELNGVIKDCLKVNAERRPDTAQLLNLPVVKLMRKEKEVVDLNKSLRSREELLRRKEKEVTERAARMDREKNMLREELDSSLRREWEVKARLEIDRLVNLEVEKLQNRFEEEVQLRVDAELQKKTVSFAVSEPNLAPAVEEQIPARMAKSEPKHEDPQSSIGGTSGDDFASVTDLTDYSIDSPEPAREVKKGNTRTPFGRAQTMFAGHAGTPMDIEMASPSPIAIASLSLSPRRNGTTKTPHVHSGNIFAANAAANGGDPRWDLPRDMGFEESDDEDIVPSPTRQIRSSKNNPFTSKTRPVLTSQKTCPVGRTPKIPSSNSGGGLVSKLGLVQGDPSSTSRSQSPNRRLSKIPSAANLQQDSRDIPSGSNSDRGLSHKPSLKKDSSEALGKVAAKNNIKGRTLVELQQARAGNRPLSAIMPSSNSTGVPQERGPSPEHIPGGNLSPKRSNAAFRDRIAGQRRDSAGSVGDVAIWDPERDEMPSPFLPRQRRMQVMNKA